MLSKSYSEAAVDVLDILNHMEWQDFSKVSTKFIEFLEENASSEYKSNLDYSKSLVEMELSPEAIGILSVMYRQFWCAKDEIEKFDNRLKENEIKFQEELKSKYDPDKIFERTSIEISDTELIIREKNKGFFEKILEKIKSILGI